MQCLRVQRFGTSGFCASGFPSTRKDINHHDSWASWHWYWRVFLFHARSVNAAARVVFHGAGPKQCGAMEKDRLPVVYHSVDFGRDLSRILFALVWAGMAAEHAYHFR